MHKLTSKPITLSDFSVEDCDIDDDTTAEQMLLRTISDCEMLRQKFNETKDKRIWRTLIQLLPMGYNQKRTVDLNYEVLANILRQRKNHRLSEWHTFCEWIEGLPYWHEIFGNDEENA